MLFDVNQDLLSSGVVILSGGADNCGVPVVTFLGQGTPNLSRYDIREVGQLVSVYMGMCGGTASFLVDLQHGATLDTITRFTGTLEYLEIQRRGSVRTVYIVKPKSRAKLRFLKKCICSHKENGSHYKVVLLKNQRDLFCYMHSSSLTWDFGGTLQYNHEAWVIFQKVVEDGVESAADVLKMFPDARDKISLLHELDTMDMEAVDINNLIEDIQLKYKTVVGNSGVYEAMDQVKQTIHKLEKPDEDTNFSQIHATLITEAIGKLRRAHTELSSVLSEIESLKEKIDSELRSEAILRDCVERANKIQTSIQSEFWPQLFHHPYVGNTVNQAEIYRTHFTASIFQPAKEILLDATQLLIDMRDLISADHGKKNKTAEVAAKLSEAVQPFARQLNRLNNTYTNIHVFHVVFEKCKSWYKKTLRSVTSYIFSENNVEAWKRLMLTHAKKHPAPRSDHIAILNEHLPTVLDSSLKEETTLLCHRVKLLLQLIKKDSISEKELSQVRAWEEDQMFINVDDSSELIDSREDLSQLQNDSENLSLQKVSQVYQNIPSNREYDQCDECNVITEMDLPISDSYFIRQFQETRNSNMNYESLEDAAFKSRDWKRQTHDQCTDNGSSSESWNTFMVKRRVRTRKAAQSKINSLPKSLSSSDLGSHGNERFIDLSYSALDQDSFGNEVFINSDYFPPEQSGVFDSVNTFLSNREISSNVQSDPAEHMDLTLTKKGDHKALMSTLLLKEKFSTQFEEQESIRFSQSSTDGPYALDLSDSSEDDTCPTVRGLLKKNLSDSFNYDPNVSGVESYVQQHEIINTADNTSSLAQVDTSPEHENFMAGDVREAQHSSGANYKSFSPQSINDSEMISVGSSRTERLLKSNDWNNVKCMILIPSKPVSMTRKGDFLEQRNNNDLNPFIDSNKDVNSAHSSCKSNLLSLQENVRRDNSIHDQTNTCHLRYSDDLTRSKILTSPLKSEHSQVPYTFAYKTDSVFSENTNANMHVSHSKHFTDSKLRRENDTKPASFITADETRNENVDLALLVRKLRNNLSKSLYDLNGDDSYVNDHLSYRLSRSLLKMNAISESILAKGKETLKRPYRNFENEIPFDPEYNEMFEFHSSSFANDANGQLWFTGSRTNPYFCNWSHANNQGMGAFYDSGKRKCSGDTTENPPIRQMSGQHYNPNEERISDKADEMNDHVEEEIARKLEQLSLGCHQHWVGNRTDLPTIERSQAH